MASHRLDVLAFLFGLPSSVTAITDIRSKKIAVEDTASLLMRYNSGLHVMAFASHCVRTPMDDFEVFGSHGELKVAPLNGDELHLTTGNCEVLHLPKPANVHLPLVEDFTQAILNNSVPRVTGEEGIKASLILDAAYQSAQEGKTVPVDWEPHEFQ
jgi:predicted dehydrogenase